MHTYKVVRQFLVTEDVRLLAQALAGQCVGYVDALHIAEKQGHKRDIDRASVLLEHHDNLVEKIVRKLHTEEGSWAAQVFCDIYNERVKCPIIWETEGGKQ